MDKNRADTFFERFFPQVCRVVLMGAILVWGGTVAKSVREREQAKEKQSAGINWQDITPTCDGVLCDLGKVHATIQEYIDECADGRLSPDDLNMHLMSAKRRLRKVNAGGLDDPDMKSALLELRQQQVALYTSMREEIGKFCRADGASEGTTTKDTLDAVANMLKEWRRKSGAFSGSLRAFAVQAGVLPDEIPDKRAAATIFAEFSRPGRAVGQASVAAGPDGRGSNDGQGGK